MSVKTIHDIRTSFLDFFRSKEHLVMPSASLLPAQDPTLLFTTAGMVPFKEFFSGAKVPPAPRLTSVQKCLRTTDLESVGKTKRHMSMFEMLGNFSFGNYFKKEAIEFAWEYSTQFLPFPKDKIWISIFENDDEAFELWNKHIGVPKERIVRLGRADNFWGPAGESGACGPCSELYLDRGDAFGTDENNRAPGGSGDRFLEFWNLVFNQFDFQKGEYLPLAQTGIDTGAGLERLATLVQNVDSVFDTDELMRLRDKVAATYHARYAGESQIPIRVLTDHIRTLAFAMSDGIYPSNESRGYVLRRVLRRAMLFGRRLGQREPMLHHLVDEVVSIYSRFYPELSENSAFVKNFIREEEARFLRTLDSGSSRLEEIIETAKAKKLGVIAGGDAFQLYDTFGFPLEMTRELAEQNALTIDETGFQEAMEKQRERGRQAWKGHLSLQLRSTPSTEFIGYEKLSGTAKIIDLIKNEAPVENISEADLSDGLLFVVTDQTPLYAEGGGQLGDTGILKTKSGEARVIDCRKQGDTFIHLIADVIGRLSLNESVDLSVDAIRRQSLMRHHSATHLLNAALKKTLGNHVKQSGSLVHTDYLRFDFTHPSAMKIEDLALVEALVNESISKCLPVETLVLKKVEAEKRGAAMTFGEKYGDVVRVVEMADFSKEFCGGTHVKNTSDIESFIITRESSPGAGNRRIEAVAGAKAVEFVKSKLSELDIRSNALLQSTEDGSLISKIKMIAKEIADLVTSLNPTKIREVWTASKQLTEKMTALEGDVRKQAKKKDNDKIAIDLDTLLETVQATPSGKSILLSLIPDAEVSQLKQIADALREKNPAAVFCLVSDRAENPAFVLATTQSYAQAQNIQLGQLLRVLVTQYPISGGGKAEMAQGLIKDVAQRDAFLDALKSSL